MKKLEDWEIVQHSDGMTAQLEGGLYAIRGKVDGQPWVTSALPHLILESTVCGTKLKLGKPLPRAVTGRSPGELTMPKIQPALTAEEWADGAFPDPGKDGFCYLTASHEFYLFDSDKHGLAARCLHNQPFGFTREGHGALEGVLAAVFTGTPVSQEEFDLVRGEVAKVGALLPPEK